MVPACRVRREERETYPTVCARWAKSTYLFAAGLGSLSLRMRVRYVQEQSSAVLEPITAAKVKLADAGA